MSFAYASHNQPSRVTDKDDTWAEKQIKNSVDIRTKFPFIFGWLNIHVAHHLFPSIDHCHLPKVTEIIKQHLKIHYNKELSVKSITYMEGLYGQWNTLKGNSGKIS